MPRLKSEDQDKIVYELLDLAIKESWNRLSDEKKSVGQYDDVVNDAIRCIRNSRHLIDEKQKIV